MTVRSPVRLFGHSLSSTQLLKAPNLLPVNRMCGTRERFGVNTYNPLNFIKLVIYIHIWVKIYTFGRTYTHSGVNNSEMCSLEA